MTDVQQRQLCSRMPFSLLPVGHTEVSVVGEVGLVGSFPGDSRPGSTADLTPEGDALAVVTSNITQRHEELWGN